MSSVAVSDFEIPAVRLNPLSRARERRTWSVYALGCVLGILPTLLGFPSAWIAAGLGLWLPGAGFSTMGPFGLILTALTLVCFAASLVAWFGSGMVIAPFIVWLGSMLLSALLAPAHAWTPAPYVTVLLSAGVLVALRRQEDRKEAANRKSRDIRNAFLPEALVKVRSERLLEAPEDARELDLGQLQLLRYALDRALQPVAEFDGFNRIDQFQTSAIRYQINSLAYALALSQCHYTPSFHGYLSLAQRNLINKYLQKRVWDYWIFESIWGHLNFSNFDPAGRDNIMLTGYLGIQVGLYMSNTGDMRYLEAGSLPFHLNDKTTFNHSFPSLIKSITDNFKTSEFCLYPCEPNWIYPICNHYGMAASVLGDRLLGTAFVEGMLPQWMYMLDNELTDSKGSPISLKSSLTGWTPPFPATDGTYVPFANCFMPERAERLWAITRTEMSALVAPDKGSIDRLIFPGAGIDFGNYRKGHAMSYAFIKMAAREMGDAAFSRLADDSLNEVGGYEVRDGVASYSKASNMGNAYAIIGAMQQRNDFRNAVAKGPAPSALTGPLLADVRYPDVLVARAYSSGEDLSLVLWPGRDPSTQSIGVERLKPGRRYQALGAVSGEIVADSQGQAKFDVFLNGRTSVSLVPVQ